MFINLLELPIMVNANDEDLFANVAETVAIMQEVDVRYAQGNILDEYHDVPLNENYPDYLTDDVPRNEVALIPRQAMIEFAMSEIAMYMEDDDDARASWALEGQLMGMPFEERVKLIRAFLDTFVPTPYNVRPTDNVFLYHVYRSDEYIGQVHFLDSIDELHPALGNNADYILYNMYRVHQGLPPFLGRK